MPDKWDQYKVNANNTHNAVDWSKYEVKKNDIPNDGENTIPQSPSTNNFLNPSIIQPTTGYLTPITDPKVKQHVSEQQYMDVGQQDLLKQQQQQKNATDLQKVVNNADPETKANWDKVNQLMASRQPDQVSATSPEEQKHYEFMQTPVGKTLGAVAYLGSKATKGTLDVVKGAAHLAKLATYMPDSESDVVDNALNKVYDNANYGLTKGDQQRMDDNRPLSALGMAAEFAPTVATGEATSAPKALMYLQGVGMGKDAATNIEKNGGKLNPIAKEALIQGTGAVNLLLTDVFKGSGISSALQDKVVTGIAADAIKESAGKEISSAAFKDLLNNGAQSFKDKFEQTGLKALSHYNETAKTFLKLNAANFALHKGVDAINEATGEKPVFNETAGNLAENSMNAVTKDAPIFAAIPTLSDATKLLPNSGYKNEVVDALMKDPSAENIDVIKKNIYDHGFDQNNPNKWSPEEMDATFKHVDKIADAAKSLPRTIPQDKRDKAVGLVLDRNVLQEQLDKIQTDKKQLDPSIQDIPTPKEQYLTDKVDQANDKLRDIVGGTKTTYSKEREDNGQETGKFLKTTDGNQEEITPERYALEKTERDAKVKDNVPESPVTEPKTKDQNNESTNEKSGEKSPEEKEGSSQKENGLPDKKSNVVNSGDEQSEPDNFKVGDDYKLDNETGKISRVKELDNGDTQLKIKKADDTHQTVVIPKKGKQPNNDTNEDVNAKSKNEISQSDPKIKTQSLTDEELARKMELRKKFMGTLNDITRIPTLLADKEFREYAGLVFKEVAGDFKAFSKELIDNVGDKIKEHLPGLFKELGGKLDEDKEEPKKSYTSARNEDTDKVREQLGLSPLMKEAARANPEVWDEVNKTLDDNPKATDELIDKLNVKIRPVTDIEQGLLIHKQIELETDVQKANEKVIENSDNGINDEFDKINLQNARKKLSDILELQNKVGREWGLSGKFRQQLFKDDFSLANLERQTRGALGGRELTKAELDNIQKTHDEFNKKLKDYEAVIKKLKEKNDTIEQQKTLNKLKKEADFENRKAKRQGKIIDFDKRIKDTLSDIKNKLKKARSETNVVPLPYAKELIAIAPELGELAKAYISKGITNLEDIVDKIHHDIKDDFDNLDKRDVRDALSGYGKEPKKSTKDELQKQLEQLKHIAKLTSKLEDLQNTLKKVTTEKAKEGKNAEIEALQKQIHELTKGETANKALITRMQNMATELKNKLANGDFNKKQPSIPVELTPEARNARAEYLRIKREFDYALERKRLSERSWPVKSMDWLVKWRRNTLFLNPTTALKLGAYATTKVISTPLHELIGSGLRKLPYFSKIADKAPREGAGFNRTAEARALASLWSKETWGDILKNIKNKEGNLKVSHQEDKISIPIAPYLDWGANLHSALKEVALHNEVERSIVLRTKHALENNIDPSEPLNQLGIVTESLKDALPGAKIQEIENKAYQDGLRSILMQDNVASKGWSDMIKYFDRISETGKFSKYTEPSQGAKTGAKTISTVLNIFLPITKVPVNLGIESYEYTPAVGAIRAFLVMRRGLDKMNPDEADYVMRVMKRQGVAAGMITMGYLLPKAFGGFQVSSHKRTDGENKANDININGVKIPHSVTHAAFYRTAQLGATMRHVHDNMKEGDEPLRKEGTLDVGLSDIRDLSKTIPFLETPSDAVEALKTKEKLSKYAADFIEGLVMPPDIKSLARSTDKHADGEPIERKPDGFGDELKMNIPGLRKTVKRK